MVVAPRGHRPLLYQAGLELSQITIEGLVPFLLFIDLMKPTAPDWLMSVTGQSSPAKAFLGMACCILATKSNLKNESYSAQNYGYIQ